MANRPSHGLQQRILAFVATRPSREIHKNGGVETCSGWISKRLDVAEKAVIAELETMEREGVIRLTRNTIGNQNIKTVQVVHGVEPESWAMAEMQSATDEPVVRTVQLPPDADYRKLADDLLLAALDAMASGGDFQVERKAFEQQIADLREANEQLRTDLSHVKVERDTNIRARKVAEQAAHDEKNKADEARTQVAELESDITDLEAQIVALQQQGRNQGLVEGLSPERQAALLKLLEGR